MQIVLSPNRVPSLKTSVVSLEELHPLVNGQSFNGLPDRTWEEGSRLFLEYQIGQPGCELFLIEIESISPIECAVRYSVHGGMQTETPSSFGIEFRRITNLRQYLRHGYHSWDGSFFVDPEALSDWNTDEVRPETGYAMTLLLPRRGSGSLVVGFDRHDRFQHTFIFNTHSVPTGLRIETLWDQKEKPRDGNCVSEKLLIFEHPEVEEALREWARRVVSVSPIAPRKVPPINGWCSWYNLYNAITEENILQHLHGVNEVKSQYQIPMDVFQIDDGFTPEMGDWLEVKPQFPRGMKPLLDDIRSAGFIPGLWIAPFLVGNRSHLFRDHPDWVLNERESGKPLAHMKLYGEFRWGKRSEDYYILDASHPKAFEYLRQVFRTWHKQWGCDYFKTDFMYFGCAYGPEQVDYHTPGLSRIEIWRRFMEMIRCEIGDAVLLGCGCPLWAAVGLVDAMRIGRDVGVEWSGNQSAQSLLRDQSTRNFTHGIFWQVDPDCILLRERFHNLSATEVRSLALLAGMSGGVRMTSDTLDELSPERKSLWKTVLGLGSTGCSYPLLGQSEITSRPLPGKALNELQSMDPVILQVLHALPNIVYIFNTGNTPVQRSYPLRCLGLPEKQYLYSNDQNIQDEWADTLSVKLNPHEGSLIYTQITPFKTAPGSV